MNNTITILIGLVVVLVVVGICLITTFQVGQGAAFAVESAMTGKFVEIVYGPRLYFVMPWNRVKPYYWGLGDTAPRKQTAVTTGTFSVDIKPFKVNDKTGIELILDPIMLARIANFKLALYDNCNVNLFRSVQIAAERLYRHAAAEMTYSELCASTSNEVILKIVHDEHKRVESELGIAWSMQIRQVSAGSVSSTKTLNQMSFAKTKQDLAGHKVETHRHRGEAAAAEYQAMRKGGMSNEDIAVFALWKRGNYVSPRPLPGGNYVSPQPLPSESKR